MRLNLFIFFLNLAHW